VDCIVSIEAEADVSVDIAGHVVHYDYPEYEVVVLGERYQDDKVDSESYPSHKELVGADSDAMSRFTDNKPVRHVKWTLRRQIDAFLIPYF